MNAVKNVIVVLSMVLAAPLSASPTASEQAYLELCRKDPGVPVPIAVVSPDVGPDYHGASVQLEFVVDRAGKPGAFSIKSATDDVLAKVVVEAVKQWRFLPAEVDGRPVATKVALPVKVVDPRLAANRYVSTK